MAHRVVHVALATFSWLTALAVCSEARANLKVNSSGQDVHITDPGSFSLRFEKARGGSITEYYDLVHDPGSANNIAARGGSLYDGLFLLMFKQESPEAWTASFRGAASVVH